MRISAKRTNRIMGFICILLLMLPLAAFAANKVVVIPLFDSSCTSGTCKPLKNIVTVAKAGGMFTDPVAAMASITDASFDNPYLVVIGPGVYTVTSPVVMKSYVDIAGSGKNITTITGMISGGTAADAAIIKGATDSTLSSLHVSNAGGSGAYSIGLYIGVYQNYMNVNDVLLVVRGGVQNRAIHNEGGALTIRGANISVSNSGGTTGIAIYNNGSAYMFDIDADVSGGTNSFGVFNVSALLGSMNNVYIWAHNSTNNHGVYNGSSSNIKMNNVDIRAENGSKGYGVYNSDSSPKMTNVTAMTNCILSYGVYNDGSSPVIRGSRLDGLTDGLFTKGGTATVSQSTIKNGAAVDTGGINTCVACDNGAGAALNGICL